MCCLSFLFLFFLKKVIILRAFYIFCIGYKFIRGYVNCQNILPVGGLRMSLMKSNYLLVSFSNQYYQTTSPLFELMFLLLFLSILDVMVAMASLIPTNRSVSIFCAASSNIFSAVTCP